MDPYSLSDSTLCDVIGNNLRYVRLKQNLTQSQLSELAGVSESSVKKIESGKIGSFDSLLRVLRVLRKLDGLSFLAEEPDMDPREYYEFVNSRKRKERKRASGTRQRKQPGIEDSEW